MKTVLSVLLGLLAAASIAACGGGGNTGTFDMDRFFEETIDNPPRGLIMGADFETGYVASSVGIGAMWAVTKRATEPVVATDVTITIEGAAGKSSIQYVVIGGGFYVRTIINGEASTWMRVPPDAQSDELSSVLEGTDAIEGLTAETFHRDEWIPAGEAPCRDRECFVLQHIDEAGRKMLIDKSTYAPIQLVWFQGPADSGVRGIVIEILEWDVDVNIKAPSGGVPEGTAEDVEAAFLAVFMAASGG